MGTKEDGKILGKLLLLLVVVIIVVCISGVLFYNNSLNLNDFGEKQIEIKSGMGVEAISNMLEEEGIIKNSLTFKVYCKLNKKTMMQAGKYTVKSEMTLDELLTMFEKGEIVNEEVVITFPEGKNIKQIAQIIAENTNNTEQSVYDLLKNEEYIDSIINEYWFINKEIQDNRIYFPLEGYLYPDTYNLTDKNESIQNIFKKMLDKMDEVLTPYKSEIANSGYSVHEILSLASVVELEAPKDDDRAILAGVFYQRLEYNMGIQSDVTTYYGLQLSMNERELTSSELAENNGYNTRAVEMMGKLPVGPICIVSESSIKAVLEPVDTDYLYFVADKNGKLYFTENYEEHNAKIQELKDQGLWFTYDN